MEDGENGAKHVWNGYIREKSMISMVEVCQKVEKVTKIDEHLCFEYFELLPRVNRAFCVQP